MKMIREFLASQIYRWEAERRSGYEWSRRADAVSTKADGMSSPTERGRGYVPNPLRDDRSGTTPRYAVRALGDVVVGVINRLVRAGN